jgi:UDP-glucose 4-epimerase
VARYLVTGGSGFLGTLLIEKLLSDGHDVASIDLLASSIVDPRLRSVIGDIRDGPLLDSIFAQIRPQAVFHCAALLAHGSVDDRELWSSNVEGTRSLADATARAGVDRLIYVSSNCLWGSGFDRPVTEADAPAPCELYGQSKWEGERILADYADRFSTTSIRCPTIIDEGRLGLLAILFEFIADGKKVWIVGRGDNRYQFIYAADLIAAMLRAAERKVPGAFGIGSDNVGTMRETFDHVIRMAASRSRTVPVPRAPAIFGMKLAHHLGISPLGPYHYRMIASSFVFDTSAIKRALGWHPTLSNRDMLWRAYRFYSANRAEIAARSDVSAHRQPAEMGVIRLLKWVS